jgi:large-conductance mechanosensitive channel
MRHWRRQTFVFQLSYYTFTTVDCADCATKCQKYATIYQLIVNFTLICFKISFLRIVFLTGSANQYTKQIKGYNMLFMNVNLTRRRLEVKPSVKANFSC